MSGNDIIHLGYWKCRGIGMPIQMVAHYLDIELKVRRYEPIKCDSGDGWDRSQWLDEKFTLDLGFPNLPYIIDSSVLGGSMRLTGSFAIIKYLVRKYNWERNQPAKTDQNETVHNLMPSKNWELSHAEMLEDWINDLRWDFIRTVYGDGSSESIDAHFDKVDVKFSQLEEFLKKVTSDHDLSWVLNGGCTGKCLVGELSYIDFYVWEVVSAHQCWKPSVLDKFPTAMIWFENFKKLEKVKQFLESDLYFEYPITSKMAIWGGREKNDGIIEKT